MGEEKRCQLKAAECKRQAAGLMMAECATFLLFHELLEIESSKERVCQLCSARESSKCFALEIRLVWA